MPAMEDLIAAISGNMHVSQDGYDIKALQEYLSQTIKLPQLPISPSTAFHGLPPSRSTSSTRKHSSLPHAYLADNNSHHQPYPSPSANMTSYFHSAEDLSMTTPVQRPGALRRTSSYGFGGTREHPSANTIPESSGFECDAFAPLYEQPPSSNPWATRPQEKVNPWAAFSGQSTSFQSQAGSQMRDSHIPSNPQPQTEDDDDAMDEDQADEDMFEIEEEDRVERAMGLADDDDDGVVYDRSYADWERGRRKQ